MHRTVRILFLSICAAVPSPVRAQQEPLFSGPQVDEKLPPLKVVGVYDQLAGREIDFVEAAAGKPLLLVFMHDLTRPSASLTRALCAYAQPRIQSGAMHAGVVWLTADRSQAKQYLTRARGSLNFAVSVGISLDGAEGPGSYGLNRKVGLTVLVAKDNRVTANFALVQPALTDGPRILAAVATLLNEKPPTLGDVEKLVGGNRATPADRLRERLRPLINKEASEEEVTRAAAAIEELVCKDEGLKRELGQIAKRVVDSGNLKNYGTPAAQEHIRRWSQQYVPMQ